MYKNIKYDRPPKHQGWDDTVGAVPYIIELLIDEKDAEKTQKNIEDFYGSHTYLWLLEARSYAPNTTVIMSIYNEEVKDGLVGFVNALLRYFPEDFDVAEDDA